MRKQKCGIYLPPLDEEESDDRIGSSYDITILPGQHKTAKTVERALKAGGERCDSVHRILSCTNLLCHDQPFTRRVNLTYALTIERAE